MVVNHGVVCWDSGCESLCAMLRQWLLIMLCYAEPMVVNHCAILIQWLWIMVCYIEPVVVNRGVIYWASDCESWCVILSQLLWIMVCYAKLSGFESRCIMLSKVVLNHDVLCWAQWLGIMVSYAEHVVVNHGLLCWASGCESWCVMLSQLLWIMVCYSEPASGCKS